MNTPNKLTILRVVLIPVFLVLMLVSQIPQHYLWALIVFAAAALTDCLDGRIARKRGLVTDFGKFLDPLADKMLVMSALICFVELGMTGSAVVIIILCRELAVTSLRLIAASKGTVIAADTWGKFKTVFQMTWIIAAILLEWVKGFEVLSGFALGFCEGLVLALMGATLFFTIFSGVNYMVKNWACISEMK